MQRRSAKSGVRFRNLSSLFDGMETGKPARMVQVADPNRNAQRAELEQTARKALAWAVN
jgi:hypothetical protein